MTSFRGRQIPHSFQRVSAVLRRREGGDSMNSLCEPTTKMAARYFHLFANRLAYTLQSNKPAANGKHYYFRSKYGRRLSFETVREHLSGRITIGLYALNPKTQRSKWVAIDADY